MTTSQLFPRLACGLAVAGAALLSAPRASAQATSPFLFGVENDTYSGGDPVFSVTDDLTFTNLQITETFAGGATQVLFLPSLSSAAALPNAETATAPPPSSQLLTAVLTGSIGTGPMQSLSTQMTIGGATTTRYVFSNFSADLFGTAPAGTALGIFSLTDPNNNVIKSVNIEALPAVPEASTTVSLGLLLLLGLGTLAVARRRAVSAS